MAEWIDVNERLPKEDTRVLVTISDENYKYVQAYALHECYFLITQIIYFLI